MAAGLTPRELDEGDTVVGLVDKRNQDYVEEFRSFSGQGNSLGGSTVVEGGVFDPASLGAAAEVDASQPTTSIAVRLLNGKRKIVKLNLTSTVGDLVSHLSDAGEPFRLVAGFPPKPLTDTSATIEASGLKGAQVSMNKA